MDFDDLLTLTVRLFNEHPDVLAHYQERFEHILVDEYQDTNRAQNEIVLMLAAVHHNVMRRRRRGPVDLPLPRRRHPQHPRVRAGVPRRHGDHARAELPVDADDPRRGERGDREQRRPQAEEPLDRTGQRRADRALPRRRRGRRGAVGRARDRAAARRRPPPLGRRRRLLPHERAEPRARGALHARGHPVQGRRRHAASTTGARSRTRSRTWRSQPGRRGERQAGGERAQARRRRHHGRTCRQLGDEPRPVVPRRAGTADDAGVSMAAAEGHRVVPRAADEAGACSTKDRARCSSGCSKGRAT